MPRPTIPPTPTEATEIALRQLGATPAEARALAYLKTTHTAELMQALEQYRRASNQTPQPPGAPARHKPQH